MLNENINKSQDEDDLYQGDANYPKIQQLMALPDAGDRDLRNDSKDFDDLTATEKAVLYGTLLGDGHMRESFGRVRAKIEHSMQYFPYVEWKYEKLKRLCSKTRPPYAAPGDKATTGLFYTTETHKYCFVHRLFYQAKWDPEKQKVRYVKTITESLLDFLPVDPLLLAVWYLDDGSARNDSYAGRFYTIGFGPQGNILLQKYLKDKYDLQTNIVWYRKYKNENCLSIPAKTFVNFIEVIEPYVKEVPCLEYKLNKERKAQSKFIK